MALEKTVDGKSVRVNTIKRNEKTIQCIFIHNEFPRADLEFTFDNRRWHLKDGKTFKLPLHVIEHLNSLVVPESHYDIDASTGQMTHVTRSLRHRFTCQPVNLKAILEGNKEDKKDKKEGK